MLTPPPTPKSHAKRLHQKAYTKALTLRTINPTVKDVEYAVRGELAQRADKYTHMLADAKSNDAGTKDLGGASSKSKENGSKEESEKLPFDKVVTANIGNPQQRGLDQKPITFWRQVISLLEYPELMDHPLASQIYPSDTVERAKKLYSEIGSVGAYTHSKGIKQIRERVAKFLEQRDGFPADSEHIFLTAGASAGVAQIMNVAMRHGEGVLIPIPQYPLYTATLASISCKAVPYELQESSGWSLSQSVLEQAIAAVDRSETTIKALVVINPGNPTGGCLEEKDMRDIVKLCYDEGIVLLADEVYQTNIYYPESKPFVSFKKIVRTMEQEEAIEAGKVELVSFHSLSKGVSGECGRRGGYYELVNIEEDVIDQLYKMASISLCPPVTGQVGVDLLVDPPKPGSPSYKLFEEETSLTHQNLLNRSSYMSEKFNALEGMSCQKAEGAMYLFPQIEMPSKAKEEATRRGKEVDVMYALDLLDATGICAVAGSGFGQKEGTYHLRVTALCPGVEEYVEKIEGFHKDFMKKYA